MDFVLHARKTCQEKACKNPKMPLFSSPLDGTRIERISWPQKAQENEALLAPQYVRIAHSREDFPISVSICGNLWPIPALVAARRTVLFAPLCGKFFFFYPTVQAANNPQIPRNFYSKSWFN
jgi:hypothetical protein